MKDFWWYLHTPDFLYALVGVGAVLIIGGMAYEAWRDWN